MRIIINLFLSLSMLVLTSATMAQWEGQVDCNVRGDRIILSFDGQEFNSFIGGQDTIALRQIMLRNCSIPAFVSIDSIRVLAKSRRERAELSVVAGSWSSSPRTVPADDRDFYIDDRRSYYRIDFRVPESVNDRRLQLRLRGNIRIQRIVLDRGRNEGRGPDFGSIITCESRDYGYEECDVGRYLTPADVQLWRVLSNAPCERGRSWGVREDAIWVDRGCRAEFRIGRP